MTTARISKKTAAGKQSFEEAGPEFIVEKILDKEVRNGEVYYYLQWLGFDDSHNCWEPAINVKGLKLLPEFERQWREKQKNRESGGSNGGRQRRKSKKEKIIVPVQPSTSGSSANSHHNGTTEKNGDGMEIGSRVTNGGNAPADQEEERMQVDQTEMNGFEKGLEPEKIIGAMKSLGVIYFLIKWKNEADPGILISNEVAKEKCPWLVFEFYEERLVWPEIARDEE